MSGLNNQLDENTLAILQNTINNIILKAQGYKKLASLNGIMPKASISNTEHGGLKIPEDHTHTLQYKATADFLINHAKKLQDVQKVLINSSSISAHTEALQALKRLNHQLLTTGLPAPPKAASTSATHAFFNVSELSIDPKDLFEKLKTVRAFDSHSL